MLKLWKALSKIAPEIEHVEDATDDHWCQALQDVHEFLDRHENEIQTRGLVAGMGPRGIVDRHVYYGRIVLSLYLDRAPWRHAVRIECCVYSSQQGEREHVYADRARRYSAWCCFPMDVLS